MNVTLMQEKQARAYCADIGADPDEEVSGQIDTGRGYCAAAKAPRWRWYVNTRRDSYVSFPDGARPCNALHGDSTVSLGEAVDRVLSKAPISLRNPPNLSLV